MSGTAGMMLCTNCGFVGANVWTANGGPYCGTCAKRAMGDEPFPASSPPQTYPVDEIARLRAEVDRLTRERDEARAWQEPMLAKFQPCGCVVCTCAPNEENRCTGCGAKMCGLHEPHEIAKAPGAIWEKHPLITRAETAEAALAELRAAAREAHGYLNCPCTPCNCEIGRVKKTLGSLLAVKP